MEANGDHADCNRWDAEGKWLPDDGSCLCKKCQVHRWQESRLERLYAIDKRLRDAGIEAEDLADLIFHRRMPVVEAMIAKRVEEAVKRHLANLLGKGLQ